MFSFILLQSFPEEKNKTQPFKSKTAPSSATLECVPGKSTLFVNVPAWHWESSVTWGCCFPFWLELVDEAGAFKLTAHKTLVISSAVCVSLEWNYDVVLCDNPPLSRPHCTWHTGARSQSFCSGELSAARFLAASGNHQARKDQKIPTNPLVFTPPALKDIKLFAQFLVLFPRTATVHWRQFNLGTLCSNCTWIDWWLQL